MSFVPWCRTFCGWLNRSWLCLHGFAIWQQKRKNGAGERFVLEIRTSSVRAYGCMEMTKSLWPSKVSFFFLSETLVSRSQSCSNEWRNLWKIMKCGFIYLWKQPKGPGAHSHRHSIWLLSIKGKLASMTCWMVCFNRRGQLQRLVVFFFQLWQVASTPGVSTPW